MKKIELNLQLALQIAVGIFLIIVGALIGYHVALSSVSGLGSGIGLGRWPGSIRTSSMSSTSCRISEADESHSGTQSSMSNTPEYLSAIEKNHLEERDRKIASVLPRTEVGRLLSRVVTLLQFGSMGSAAENRLFVEDLKLLERQPDEAFQAIRENIRKLGDEFSDEQQYLIYLVGKLDINPSDRLDFLISELNRVPTSTENKQSKLNRGTALAVLLQLGADPSTVESKLRETFSIEPSYLNKIKLLGLYEAKYPDSANKLKEDFGL
jgi:hypothetical protein